MKEPRTMRAWFALFPAQLTLTLEIIILPTFIWSAKRGESGKFFVSCDATGLFLPQEKCSFLLVVHTCEWEERESFINKVKWVSSFEIIVGNSSWEDLFSAQRAEPKKNYEGIVCLRFNEPLLPEIESSHERTKESCKSMRKSAFKQIITDSLNLIS